MQSVRRLWRTTCICFCTTRSNGPSPFDDDPVLCTHFFAHADPWCRLGSEAEKGNVCRNVNDSDYMAVHGHGSSVESRAASGASLRDVANQ